jgi:hypothetical protein
MLFDLRRTTSPICYIGGHQIALAAGPAEVPSFGRFLGALRINSLAHPITKSTQSLGKFHSSELNLRAIHP